MFCPEGKKRDGAGSAAAGGAAVLSIFYVLIGRILFRSIALFPQNKGPCESRKNN